jgi:hypothetical protein
MAKRITKTLGTTYSDKEVGKMVKSTKKIPGSVLRKTGGGVDKILKIQGRRVTNANRKAVVSSAAKGKGGFSVMAKGKRRGGASKGRAK